MYGKTQMHYRNAQAWYHNIVECFEFGIAFDIKSS